MKEYLRSQGKRIDFEGAVFLIELDNGLKAVFKTFSSEDLSDAYAEVAAYDASVVLGFPDVPPTILRTIKEIQGSLQLFVETPIDTLEPGVYSKALEEIDLTTLNNLKIFYFVFGQWDSGPHNLLIFKSQEKTHLIAIDNSGIHNHQHVKYGDLPFVRICYSEDLNTQDWDKPFPFHLAQTISEPTQDNLRRVFGKKVPETFYESFKSYNEPFHYVVYQNSIWRQFHAFDQNFVRPFVKDCPESTRIALKKLNLPLLKKIFVCAKGSDFLTPTFFQAILKRRDQVLDIIGEKKSK
jgi:hypothetical protein